MHHDFSRLVLFSKHINYRNHTIHAIKINVHPIAECFANNGDKIILMYLLKIHDYEFLAY